MASSPPPTTSFSPCPSPSPSVASTASALNTSTGSANNPGWHFPGPSTKYHRTERPRPTHSRFKSTYTPRGPSLSTERRAHQRAQSYQVARGLPSPPGSESGRSPLARFPSFTPNGSNAPATPSRIPVHSRRRSSLLLQDSPFSDYFTDDARSAEDQRAGAGETQDLLVRLGKLQSSLMRGRNAPEVLDMVGQRIAEMEEDVGNAWAEQRTPVVEEESEEMGESGYFTGEEREGLAHPERMMMGLDGADEGEEEVVEPRRKLDWGQERNDKLLAEAQKALHQLTTAQRELKQRYRELRGMHDESCARIEEKEMEVERLRSENESLKSDLGFDHSELLFLELQMRGLEVDSGEGDGVKTERLQEVIESWREDWCDVESRFKSRSQKYGVKVEDANGVKLATTDEEPEDRQDWKVEVQKQSSNRVASLTLRRVSKEAPTGPGADDDNEPTEDDSTVEYVDDTILDTSATTDPSTTETKSIYTSTATQTTFPLSSSLPPEAFASPVLSAKTPQTFDFGYDVHDSDPSKGNDDDCAITTSPPSYAGIEDDDATQVGDEDVDEVREAMQEVRKRKARAEQKRYAWRELWDGLANLAGVGDHDE